MKKRLLSAALAVCMLFGSAAALPDGFLGESTSITASADSANGYTYTVKDGKAVVTRYANRSEATVSIPAALGGYPVATLSTQNGIGIFANVGGMANTVLKTLTLPSSVTAIEASALSSCTALTSLTLNSGLKTIGNYAFLNAKSLTSVTIPATVTSISKNAFDGCVKLTAINVASGNSAYSAYDGALYNKAQSSLIFVPTGKTSVKFPGTLTTIPGMMLSSMVTSVTISEGTKTIEKWAFINCKNMTSITIPASVTTIGAQAVGYYHENGDATDPEVKKTGFVIKGYEGSAAQTYAKNNGFTFQSIGTVCTHTWGTTPSWAWTGTSSAKATFTCTKCGAAQTAAATITSAVTKQPTCAAKGVRTYTAKVTFNSKSYTATKTEDIPIDSNAHVWGTTPTWTWNGYSSATAALTCSKCGSKKTAGATITSKVTKEATCSATGTRTYTATATIDGKTYTNTKTEVIPKDTSKHVWGTTPTWTWNGYSSATAALTCSKCGSKKTAGATITSKVTKAATCSATGTRTYTATATIDGKTYTDTKTVTIPVDSNAHVWGTTPSWTWSSDYKTATAVIACVNNASHTQKVTVNTTAATTAATCTAAGKTVYTAKASIGGKTYTDTRTVTIPALGHKWGEWKVTKEPTETTLGAKERVCTRSGCTAKETDSIPVTTHTHIFRSTVVDPTVTAQGYTAHQCTGCSYNFRDNFKKKLSLRIYGNSRYETSMKTADRFRVELGKAFDNVIVASGEDYADALSASYLAKVKNAPILIVSKANTIMDTVTAYIKKNAKSGANVYIIGGTGAVPAEMETKLKNAGMKPTRLAGDNRYDTNIAVLKKAGVTKQEMLIASGLSYADALSGSAVGLPIMLVGKKLTDAQVTYLRSLSGTKATIIGGTGAVSEAAATAVGQCGKSVSRLGGSTRYQTSLLVAQKYFPNAPTLALAYGLSFPDGLCGGALAMRYNCPLILATSKNTDDAHEYAKSIKAENTVTFGGTALISDSAIKTILKQ